MRTDVDSAAAPEIVVEDPEARSKRLVGPAFWVAFVLTAAGLLVSVNQIFNLGLGGFRPVSTAYYYLVIGLFGRSEERRVGKECDSRGRSRGGTEHEKKKKRRQ